MAKNTLIFLGGFALGFIVLNRLMARAVQNGSLIIKK